MFRKGERVSIGVPEGVVWARVQGGGEGGVPLENEGRGEGWNRQRNQQVNAHAFVKTTL